MDITTQYKSIIKNIHQEKPPEIRNDNFYDRIYSEIFFLKETIDSTVSYTILLKKEQSLLKINESLRHLALIDIDANSDERTHFDGIRKILNRAAIQTQMALLHKKKQFSTQNIEIQEDYTAKNEQRRNISIMKDQPRTQKSKSITKHLQEIQSIQTAISTHLLEQDESIDKIVNAMPTVDIIKVDFNRKGKYFIRFLSVFINCSSVLMLFVYFYYKFEFQ